MTSAGLRWRGSGECRLRSPFAIGVAAAIAAVAWSIVPAARPLIAQGPLILGHTGVEARVFFTEPLTPEQPRWTSFSVKLQPELIHTIRPGIAVSAVARLRLDENDSERSYADVREALVQVDHGPLLARLGVHTVFWGVTESRHLVNVVNQTDYLDDLNGDQKFGQLMARLTYDTGDLGLLDVFAMSRFRALRFPGAEGRPGVPLPILDEDAVFESSLDEWHVDLAARWSHAVREVDWAASYFYGTSREPELIPAATDEPGALAPRYDLIHQGGLELQWTNGDWLWKAEALVRQGQGPFFGAATVGFEHTTVGVLGSGADLGLLIEYSYDGRDNLTFNIYDDDLFGAVRLSMHDVGGSEILAGVLTDLESGVTFATLEASRRVGDAWRVELLSRLFWADGDDRDPLYWFREDDYMQVALEYHF